MQKRETSLAFVFAKEPHLEFDYFFSVFSKKFGKLKILAKGIRKINSKLISQMELFSFVEIEFIKGKRNIKLVGARKVDRLPFLKKKLKRIILASEIGELLEDFLKEEEPDENIWNLLVLTFSKLNEISFKKEVLVYFYFFWHFISFLGFKPNLQRCVFCFKIPKDIFFFSEKYGGIACQFCAKKNKIKNRIQKTTLLFLQVLTSGEMDLLERVKLKKSTIEEISRLTKNYLEIYKLKS
ncbi:DNA repair protein RecO [Candidatus Parcubacteria bacterium]|nr:DNA repair protein RecO [Candidatus Parcubacteria bacterium]